MVIPKATPTAWMGLAQAILAAVRELAIPHDLNEAWGRGTLSTGGARVAVPESTLVPVLRLADERLYQAKHAGRNQAVFE